jgi:PPP family 3-phenylpropionic acid transporter
VPLILRLGLYYAALNIVGATAGPYIGLWFNDRGLTGAQIGLILAVPSVARTVTGPLLALWADGFALRRTPLMILALAAAAGYGAFQLSQGFWAWAILWFLAQTLFAALGPLTDVIALRRAAREGFNYGLPRGVGSGAYILANLLMGLVVAASGSASVIAVAVAGALLSGVGARLLLPPDPVHEDGEVLGRRDRLKGLGGLVRDPVFMTALVSIGLIQASHGFYYGFSNLTWARQGVPHWLFGVLWGVGVTAEVLFLWFMEPWRREVGPERLVIWGGVGALVRWTALAFSPPLWLLIPVQALHTLTFTATYIGSLQLIERLSPRSSASAAQTLASALSGGLLMGLATSLSGWLFDRVGAYGYLAMSGLALAGLAGALSLGALQRRREAQPQDGTIA